MARSRGEGRRRGRLSRSGDFDRVYREGRSRGNRFLVLYAFPRREGDPEPASRPEAGDDASAETGPGGVRLGISVSRKVGGAVDRNTVKRALREAFWSKSGDLPDGHDFVVVARPDSAGLVEREGTAGVATALADLLGEGPAAGEERST